MHPDCLTPVQHTHTNNKERTVCPDVIDRDLYCSTCDSFCHSSYNWQPHIILIHIIIQVFHK